MVLVQGNPDPNKADTLKQYQQTARTIIGKYGGEVVARGGGIGKLHGSKDYQVGIVIRFPDKAAVDSWYGDPEYQAVVPLRDGSYIDLEITMFQE
jgi:uncharacterized protein (DUF1330 family)